MSISDNNFPLPDIPQSPEVTTSGSVSETGSLGDHAVSPKGAENPDVSTTGDSVISHIGEDAQQAHTSSPVSISTTGSSSALDLSKLVKFSVENSLPYSPNLSRSNSESDVSSLLGSRTSLSGLSRSESAPKMSAASSSSDFPSLPKYEPKSKESIQSFLRNPSVLKNMKEKGGHFIYPDHARSSFIFIPNGDFSKAKSIIVTSGKNKTPITNPADYEMCLAKFSVAYNGAQEHWSSKVTPTMQERAGSPGAPVEFTHFLLNFKLKTAEFFGPFNEKESSSGFTPSSWRKGTNLKMDKNFWGDVGGLNNVDLNGSHGMQPGSEEHDTHFHTETPQDSQSRTESTTPPASGSPQQPVVININVAGGQGGQGGTSTSSSVSPDSQPSPSSSTTGTSETTTEKQTHTLPGDDTDIQSTSEHDSDEESTSSIGTDKTTQTEHADTVHWSESDDPLDEAGNEPLEGTSSQRPTSPLVTTDFKTLLKKIKNHLKTVYESNGNYIGDPSKPQIRDIVKAFENGDTDSGSETSESPEPQSQPVAAQVVVSGPERFTTPEEPTASNLEAILKKTRAHIEQAYGTDGKRKAGALGNIIKQAEGPSSQETTHVTSKIPSLSLVEEPSSKALHSAAQEVSSSLQDLLKQVTASEIKDISGKIVESRESTDSNTKIYPVPTRIPSLSLEETPSSAREFHTAAQDVSSSLKDLLSKIDNSSTRDRNASPSNTDSDSSSVSSQASLEEAAAFKTLLKNVRSHVETAFSSEGTRVSGGIGNVVKQEEKKIPVPTNIPSRPKE